MQVELGIQGCSMETTHAQDTTQPPPMAIFTTLHLNDLPIGKNTLWKGLRFVCESNSFVCI